VPAVPAELSRITVGNIDVTFVPDGFGTSNPVEWFSGGDENVWASNPHVLDANGSLVMSLGSLLMHTAGKLILVDLAWGPTPPAEPPAPELGRRTSTVEGGALVSNLRRLGISPEDIDAVLFSHLHPDHVGWLVDPSSVVAGDDSGARPTFPNAEHYLSEPEWAYWSERSESGQRGAPSPTQLRILGSRLRFVSDGETLFPGLDGLATFGHTPGHLSFAVSSGHERALLLGDAVHCPVEMLEPEMSFALDVDPELAKKVRVELTRSLAGSETMVAAPHFPDLVFGRLLKGEGRPKWFFPDRQALEI
jgi:glyoxylase-like metal-dependent hydrolase (beta-lactamase superfamily II)